MHTVAGYWNWTLCALASAAVAQVQTESEPTHWMITRDLRVERVALQSFSQEHMVLLVDGKSRERKTTEALALIRVDPSSPSAEFRVPDVTEPSRGFILLADDRKILGAPVVSEAAGEGMVQWNGDLVGSAQYPIESLRRMFLRAVTPDSPERAPAIGSGDLVLLANGDRVEGFLVGFGTVATIEDASSHELIEIPLERVAQVRIAGPALAPAANNEYARLWTSEGSIFDVAQVTWSPEEVRYSRTPEEAHSVAAPIERTYGPEIIRAVEFRQGSLVPLARLPLEKALPSEWNEVALPPRVLRADALLGLSDVEFIGPMEAIYVLPPGASRLAAEVELPSTSWDWGDVDLVVHVDEQEIVRRHFDADNPVFSLTTPLPPGRLLHIKLEEAGNGPVQDRLLFHQPMLRVN